MDAIGFLWNEIIIRPMVNALVLLYAILWHNFGLSIIVFTAMVKVATLPLIIKTVRQQKAMARIQPKLAELTKKFPNDPQKRSQATMALYREAGFNPIGCLGPMLVQFLVFIGLYQALIQTVQATPDAVVALSEKLYSWLPLTHQAVPLNNAFLGMDLSNITQKAGVPFNVLLPALVGITTWVTQRMTTMPATTPQAAQQNQIMLWMMPVMLGWFTLTFPTGLALYWIASNVIQVALQIPIQGQGLQPIFGRKPAPTPAPALTESGPIEAEKVETDAPEEKKQDAKPPRSDRQDGGRGNRSRSQRAGRNSRRR